MIDLPSSWPDVDKAGAVGVVLHPEEGDDTDAAVDAAEHEFDRMKMVELRGEIKALTKMLEHPKLVPDPRVSPVAYCMMCCSPAFGELNWPCLFPDTSAEWKTA